MLLYIYILYIYYNVQKTRQHYKYQLYAQLIHMHEHCVYTMYMKVESNANAI